MTLYTRKGDKGDTSAFGSCQRFSKNSTLAEALGSVDEINSFLGICKTKSADLEIKINNLNIGEIIEKAQQDLFIIQANLAGADKKISHNKTEFLESIIDNIEKQLPPVKNFFLSGGDELAAFFDYSRTIARRAERRVVAYFDLEKEKSFPEILAYLNRLSSLLYALARIVNLKSGKKEQSPLYE